MASYYEEGITCPTKEEFEASERGLREDTARVISSGWSYSKDAWHVLQRVLFDANTIRNYCRLYLTEKHLKRRRDNVNAISISDSKYTLSNLLSKTNQL
jgi:hypothetical protein